MSYNYSRTAARPSDLEKPAQDVLNLCQELYRLTGRIEAAAKRMKAAHPEAAAMVLERIDGIDMQARHLSTDVDEALGIE